MAVPRPNVRSSSNNGRFERRDCRKRQLLRAGRWQELPARVSSRADVAYTGEYTVLFCAGSRLLRYSADWRSALLVVLVTSNLFVQWSLPEPNAWLIALSIVLALPLAAMGHNHNHLHIWRPAWMNVAMSYWLSFFYGLPTLSWLAVHHCSHHSHANVAAVHVT